MGEEGKSLMNKKLNFSFIYIYVYIIFLKKTLRKNSFKLNNIFWNKTAQAKGHNFEFILKSDVNVNEDSGFTVTLDPVARVATSPGSLSEDCDTPPKLLGWPELVGHHYTLAGPGANPAMWDSSERQASENQKMSFKLTVVAPAWEEVKEYTPFLPQTHFPSWSSADSGSLINILFQK